MRLVEESASQYESPWAAITSIAAKIGGTSETLRRWVRQRERDTSRRQGPSTTETERGCSVGLRQRNRSLRCPRVQRDDVLATQIESVWQTNMQVYGADKVWSQLKRERCTAVYRCSGYLFPVALTT